MKRYAPWPESDRLVVIRIRGGILVLGETELQAALAKMPELWANALKRGKAYARAEQRRRREAEADRKARRDQPCWK